MNETVTIASITVARMGFALLGGAVAWTGHLLLSYAIAEFGCASNLDRFGALGVSLVSWLLLGVSAGMIAVASGALAVSNGIRQRTRAGDADDRETAAYVGRFGLICNGLFLFVILIESVPIFFYLGRC
jgi:hypothetical protein